jgi:hypothetical protein
MPRWPPGLSDSSVWAERSSCPTTSIRHEGALSTLLGRGCVRGGGHCSAGFLWSAACGQQAVVVPDRGHHVRASRPGAPRRTCNARRQLRWLVSGPCPGGDAPCQPEDRASHGRRAGRRFGEPARTGFSAAPQLTPVCSDERCPQPGRRNGNVPRDTPRARSANFPCLVPLG